VITAETIRCTREHPFWTMDRAWVKARNLTDADVLLDVAGDAVPIMGISHEILRVPVRVYAITVNGDHTYYVGESRVLVRNKNFYF